MAGRRKVRRRTPLLDLLSDQLPAPKRATAKRKTDYEAILATHLDFAGYRYAREFKFYPKRQWRCDFYLSDYELMVEVEGIKYRGVGRHQSGVGFQADCEKYNTITALGYRLLRFTPAQVMGKAKRGVGKTKMDSAIDVIDKICLGDITAIDRTKKGYAKV